MQNFTLRLLKRQSRSELKELSAFLQSKNDEDMCEIIDVLTHCGTLKRKLVDGDKSINSGLTFKLEQVVDSLDKVEVTDGPPTEQEWKAYAEIFSKALQIHKLRFLQSPVAQYGVRWIQKTSLEPKTSPNTEETIDNPFQYLEKIIRNEEIGFVCDGTSADFRQYFDECRSKEWGKMSHVLKTASDCCFNDGKTYGVAKKGGWRWEDQIMVSPESGEKYDDFTRAIKKRLVTNGIVEENCKNLYWKFFGVTAQSPESGFCHEINKLVFGNTVSEKLGESILISPFFTNINRSQRVCSIKNYHLS